MAVLRLVMNSTAIQKSYAENYPAKAQNEYTGRSHHLQRPALKIPEVLGSVVACTVNLSPSE